MLHFSLRLLPGEKAGISVVVSKKTAKLAVTRNLIKRRVRAVVRRLKPGLGRGLTLISARPGAEKVKGEELVAEIRALFKL